MYPSDLPADAAAPNVSPALRAPLRTEAEAREQRDDAIIAGLLIFLDGMRIVAAKQQDRAATERGRIACAAVIDGLEMIRARLVWRDGGVS